MHGNRYIQSIQLATSSKDVVSNGDQKIQSMWLLISYMLCIAGRNYFKVKFNYYTHTMCLLLWSKECDQ